MESIWIPKAVVVNALAFERMGWEQPEELTAEGMRLSIDDMEDCIILEPLDHVDWKVIPERVVVRAENGKELYSADREVVYDEITSEEFVNFVLTKDLVHKYWYEFDGIAIEF